MAELFSAYAEVFPKSTNGASDGRTFLCLRRGVSVIDGKFQYQGSFSLPTQRCFPPQ